MKWEPLLAMALVLALGVYLVLGPLKYVGLAEPRAGAELHELRLGPSRGFVELLRPDGAERSFRVLLRDGSATEPFGDDEFIARFGPQAHAQIVTTGDNPLFKLFNITSWGSLVWIGIGLGGQVAFFGRMALQWVVSERRRQSVVPPAFWYLSLTGGIALFTYFVWRQDFVGVLGQTSGLVIYARNIRLLYKQRRRERREAAKAKARAETEAKATAPEPAEPAGAP